MKRILALILCVLMLAALMAGCSGKSGGETPSNPSSGGGDKPAPAAEKTLTFGCQMYSDGMIAPWLQTNCAWNCMRFGISESFAQECLLTHFEQCFDGGVFMPDQIGNQQDAAAFQQGVNPRKSQSPVRLVAHVMQHGGRDDDIESTFRQWGGSEVAFNA